MKATRSTKILFLVTEDWYFRSHRLQLAKQLSANGFEVTVGTRINEPLSSNMDHDGIKYLDLPFRRSLSNPLNDLRTCIAVFRCVKRYAPDVVHLVALKPIVTSLFAVMLLPDVKFVHAFAGMGYLFSSSDRRARWVQKIVLGVLRLILSRSNSWVLVQNVDDQQLVRDLGWVAEDRIAVIAGSGVEIPDVEQIESNKQRLVVLPARMIKDKGITEFVAAATKLSAQFQDVRFALVGGIDVDNPASLTEAQINEVVGSGAVEWWGHQQDMAEVYRVADIVCLPSYREGLPKVLLEAAAFGKAIVTTDVPGCREICLDEQTGLLVPARDSEALAAALERMLSNPAFAKSCGQAARKRVAELYSLESITEQTSQFYRRIVGPIRN